MFEIQFSSLESLWFSSRLLRRPKTGVFQVRSDSGRRPVTGTKRPLRWVLCSTAGSVSSGLHAPSEDRLGVVYRVSSQDSLETGRFGSGVLELVSPAPGTAGALNLYDTFFGRLPPLPTSSKSMESLRNPSLS